MRAPSRAVLVDLDDTLMPEVSAVAEAFAAACAPVAARSVDPAALAASVRAEARALWRTCPIRAWCLDIGVASWEALAGPFCQEAENESILLEWAPGYRREAWRRAMALHALEDGKLAATLQAAYVQEKLARYAPYPEVPEVLRRLRQRYTVVLVTNGASSIQRDKIRRAGLADALDHIVVSGEIGHGKPAAAIFAKALELAAVSAEQAVMVGNSIRSDVEGARSFGLRAVWVNREGAGGRPQCDAVVRDLSELPERLAALG